MDSVNLLTELALPVPLQHISLTTTYQGDQKDLIKILNEKELSFQLQNVPYPYTQESADFYVPDSIAKESILLPLTGKINSSTSIDLRTGNVHLPLNAIRIAETREVIGNVRLWPVISEDSVDPEAPNLPSIYQVGYYLSTLHQGQGILTASLRLLLDYARLNFKHVKIIRARVWKGNGKSLGICRRLGFEKVGTEFTTWPETKGGGERELEVWHLKL